MLFILKQNLTVILNKNVLDWLYAGYIHSDVKKGAATSIMLAVSPHVKDLRGYYFAEGVPHTPSAKARSVHNNIDNTHFF